MNVSDSSKPKHNAYHNKNAIEWRPLTWWQGLRGLWF